MYRDTTHETGMSGTKAYKIGDTPGICGHIVEIIALFVARRHKTAHIFDFFRFYRYFSGDYYRDHTGNTQAGTARPAVVFSDTDNRRLVMSYAKHWLIPAQ